MSNIIKAFRTVVMNIGLGLTFVFGLTFLAGAIYYIHGVAQTALVFGIFLVLFIIGGIIREVERRTNRR